MDLGRDPVGGQSIDRRRHAYAESSDGIHWHKPDLGLESYAGCTADNLVLTSRRYGPIEPDVSAGAIFLDTNPTASPAARYKALFRSFGAHGLVALQSPDGLRWSPLHPEPVITAGSFDSQNLAFWDEARGHYRAYWRYTPGWQPPPAVWSPTGPRGIRTAISTDFIHWGEPKDLAFTGSPPPEELYTNAVAPYPRAPHLYLGFPLRYQVREPGPSLMALPDAEHRAWRSGYEPRFGRALTDAVLMCSRDGETFTRWPESFLRPGPERSGTWNYGHQVPAWHLAETASDLGPDAPPELSLYSVENYWIGPDTRLRRHTLRLDGFVSLHAPRAGGEVHTPPLVFSGCELRLNFATSAAGEVRVELQDAEGHSLPGFALDDCDPLFGDSVDRPVTWRGQGDLSSYRGTAVHLRFSLQDANVYALHFARP